MGYLGNERDVVQDTILKYVQEEQGVYKTAEGVELFLNLAGSTSTATKLWQNVGLKVVYFSTMF